MRQWWRIHLPMQEMQETCLIPRWKRSPGVNGSPLQHSCLENPMDRGAWWATVHGVAKSQTRLSDWAQPSNRIADIYWNIYMHLNKHLPEKLLEKWSDLPMSKQLASGWRHRPSWWGSLFSLRISWCWRTVCWLEIQLTVTPEESIHA